MTSQEEVLSRLLDKPVGPTVPTRKADPDADFSRRIEIGRDTIQAEIRARVGEVNEGSALTFLEEEGLTPDDWEVTNFRKIKYGKDMESVKFSYKRASGVGDRLDIDELVALTQREKPVYNRPDGDFGYIVALGDLQFGKIDGDGVEGTLMRVLDYLDEAAALLTWFRSRFDIGHVHLAWLGDHIEGFNSQGGANAWRTGLTLTEQIRLLRRVMLHAMITYAPLAERLSMAAIPGNHGEAVRFVDRGVTRYDDSHDTESLIAVSDAAKLNADAFSHVEFYVPDNDELTVTLPIAGTNVAHAHGHQMKTGKHFEWWKGQAFSNPTLYAADVLLAGHLHHEHDEADGKRMFIQVPALESESTWWRHKTGTTGNPGLTVLVVKDGRVYTKEVVRG